MNNGPKTISELKSALPKEIVASINFFAYNDLLIKDGNTISANEIKIIIYKLKHHIMSCIKLYQL